VIGEAFGRRAKYAKSCLDYHVLVGSGMLNRD
jgi:hypothetical protein